MSLDADLVRGALEADGIAVRVEVSNSDLDEYMVELTPFRDRRTRTEFGRDGRG